MDNSALRTFTPLSALHIYIGKKMVDDVSEEVFNTWVYNALIDFMMPQSIMMFVQRTFRKRSSQ